MRGIYLIALAVGFCFFATFGVACELAYDERSSYRIRAESKPVEVDDQCRTSNINVDDVESLGAAQDLGAGRVLQSVSKTDSTALLADCNTRELVVLVGPSTIVGETSCGPRAVFSPILGPAAVFDLSRGEDLHQLVSLAEVAGLGAFDPNKRFFEFYNGLFNSNLNEVGGRDRFDLLCGCKVYYPTSPGAKP
ncbi:hypothetical protein QTO30_06850 [Yoonia sp. GPGPB17]|uniref:hypothetical protein n=1 Tax=Yoonia sp. GPGPB17 TaxID=3026147 RepID=UPI0030C4148B